MKKHFIRLLMFVSALVIGGILGYKLLVGYEPIKITLFVICVIVLGAVYHQIDKNISSK